MRISQRTEKIAFFSKSRLLSEIKPYTYSERREREKEITKLASNIFLFRLRHTLSTTTSSLKSLPFHTQRKFHLALHSERSVRTTK